MRIRSLIIELSDNEPEPAFFWKTWKLGPIRISLHDQPVSKTLLAIVREARKDETE